MKISDFDYLLPQELIAQTPIEPRDHSRLLVVDRGTGALSHRRFFNLPEYLQAGDVLIFNNSRVIRARLHAIRRDNSQRIEILLLRRLERNLWEALIGSKKKVLTGMQAVMEGFPQVTAEVTEIKDAGVRVVRFSDETVLPQIGEVPLPPYIHAPLTDPERYQTVYAEKEGSVAAPTAGLHFTPELLEKIKNKGVHCLFVTLHVGLNTFRPVQTEEIKEHPIFPEYGLIPQAAADQINLAKAEGRRVICVGTTSVRLVESAAHASENATIQAWDGWVNDFIAPGYQFKVMDALITNFHLPKSTLMMLVSALTGRELLFKAYHAAIAEKYRFYSFGDAMLIL
ncbi:MAG TPA: tRNA preQ1(34) S-adenosylmethionine ribosyltransferase-isomerase QueA [Dehalococcoidales bacterium]|nr:tRNA preQ1(34) S-adenosylmethionine ribosyltransferase-isomerase QueA [Dehalococcoidales bacterium]